MIIKMRIFQKYFFIASSLIILFIVLGFVFNNYMMGLMKPPLREPIPPIFIAKIVDRLNPTNKVRSLEELESWHNDNRGPKVLLVDASGDCLYPKNCKLDFNWKDLSLPKNDYDFISVKNLTEKPKPPPRFGLFGPPLGPPHDQNESTVIKLNNPQPIYLVMSMGGPPMMPPPGFGPLFGLASLLISLLLGIGVTIAVIYNSVKKGVGEADHVISEIKSGNLKSRFQVTRSDEFGQAMLRFNKMADEIEKLVHDLKTSEQARTKVLQELAHDLRTPLASLRNLVETLQTRGEKIDASTQLELLVLSLKEIDYFERLVEDLLFLAQLKEPNYTESTGNFNLPETILDVAEDCVFMNSQKGRTLTFSENLQGQELSFPGNDHPIRRLIRNAVENAASFARGQVTVRLEKLNEDTIRITIADDGPGFKPEDINNFGQRSVSRKLNTDANGRVSLGLGSVVIKTICDVYHGKLQVQNLTDTKGAITGAELTVELPYYPRR